MGDKEPDGSFLPQDPQLPTGPSWPAEVEVGSELPGPGDRLRLSGRGKTTRPGRLNPLTWPLTEQSQRAAQVESGEPRGVARL